MGSAHSVEPKRQLSLDDIRVTWKANIILYEIFVMKKLWIAVNSTSFLLIRYEMTNSLNDVRWAQKLSLKVFWIRSFFLRNVGHSIWYLLAQDVFKPPKPFLIILRKEILSEIPNRWNQNNSNLTFYRLKSQTNCSKNYYTYVCIRISTTFYFTM